MRPAEHIPDTEPSFATGCIVDFFLHNGTTEPLPCTGLAAPRDREPLRLPIEYGLGVDRQTVGLSSRHQGKCWVGNLIIRIRIVSQDIFAKQALGSGDEHRDLAPRLRALCCMPQVVVALEIQPQLGCGVEGACET
jgi:hypothetical protein